MSDFADLIKLAAFADSVGVEVLEFSARDGASQCEMVGCKLGYFIAIDTGGPVSLRVTSADRSDVPEVIVRDGNWHVAARLISALERSRVDSLAERPLINRTRVGAR